MTSGRRRGSRRVRPLTIIGCAVAILAAGLCVLGWTFGSPSSDEPAASGPIVVLGGNPERLDPAMRLRGRDQLLVVSASAIGDLEGRGRSCHDERAMCVEPVPEDTRGEARALASLAAERGWTAATVVTSRHHVPRTRWILQHCVDADVRVVAATEERPSRHLAAREALSTAASMLLHRGC